LLSNNEPDGTDIRKFESLGTRSFASEMAIGTAADFHQSIGSARKQARLHYLQRYWTDKARQIPGVTVHTSKDVKKACAIALFSIEGMKTTEVDSGLYTKHKIHTVGIDWENIHGVRVTPHVYTSIKDLDRLVTAIDDLASTARRKS
jgi:selenocysteine lyase/cysteine desulfurase